MSYPGNASLGDEIQQKILATFRQTLDLAEEGRRDEALLGCDFIRRLDPDFKLAQVLLERLEGQDGAVSIDDLRRELEGPGSQDLSSPSELDGVTEEVDELFAGIDGGEERAEIDPETIYPVDEEDSPASADSAEAEAAVGSEASEAGSAAAEPAPADSHDQPEEPLAGETAVPEPSAALDRESEERVDQLLSEGQAAFGQAQYQTAIDAWSRIFLIDIDHPEANRRIELARKLKAEVERKVEEAYHEALTSLESGSIEVATNGFEKVLKLQPGHLAAQEHLERLVAGELPSQDAGEVTTATPGGDATPEIAASEFSEFSEDSAQGDPEFEPLVPPFPGEEFAAAESPDAPRPAPARRPSRRTAVVIAGLVLVVAVVAAWFLRSNWSRFFPNAAEEVAAPQRPKVDPIIRAQGLHVDGNTAMAISQLRRLPPAHPQYAEAQALIAQWETVLEEESDEGPSDDQLSERDELIAEAREAFANREFLVADELFTLAAQVAPLDDGAAALQAETIERLEPLQSEIEIFRQGEWAYALRSLWRQYEADPSNRDILHLMIDGYYNLGVRDLQRGDAASAVESLNEAAALAGNDLEIERLLEFANVYTQRPPDLLYRIFVKYLPFR